MIPDGKLQAESSQFTNREPSLPAAKIISTYLQRLTFLEIKTKIVATEIQTKPR